MRQLPTEFWESDRASRVKLAGDRPGNAVFFYNDEPPCVKRPTHAEATSGFVSVLRYADRPLFAEIQTLIETRIMSCFPGCDVLRVQLAELPPGGIIKPHRDIGILALIHRLHIPIVTHKRVSFTVAGQPFFLTEGTLYDLNNTAIHSVENNSHIMRIHLLVDMMPHSVARARYYDTEESMAAALAG
ncbi:MAG TPA: aspartyl/asparaginyl beta-hydroxylase domain-containing protein [Spongiibacteraceae bacterium]|nr:aspartyl/asparaginyl beta-hydroxylase domain-containing protein [Spongiibacteraceae bacterium]